MTSPMDQASQQLPQSLDNHQISTATNGAGIPIPSLTESLTVGSTGYTLLQDSNLTDHLARFNRERISERPVHAKGAGAFGYFEMTHDISRYTRAKCLEMGKRTRVAVRMSTSNGELGSSEISRRFRGFAIKFYTEEGIWDVVNINTPVFAIRDPMLFPSFSHSRTRNPVTHLMDFNMEWDFITSEPQTTHQVMFNYSDRGISDGYRHMHGFGVNAYKFVNSKMEAVYVKFHFRCDQGIKNLSVKQAQEIQSKDLDYATRDLYNAIACGNYPSWTFCIQVMTFEEAEKFRWNPFDATKVWPHSEFPLIPAGRIVLNENVRNHFNEIEQIAFSPSNMPPGIEPSSDRILQIRLLVYFNSQIHRLGVNHLQLPVNNPKGAVHTYTRNGLMSYFDPGDGPNYYPNTFRGPQIGLQGKQSTFQLSGNVTRYNIDDDDNYSQPNMFWDRCLNAEERQRIVDNIADELQFTEKSIQRKAVRNFTQVKMDFGLMLRWALEKRMQK